MADDEYLEAPAPWINAVPQAHKGRGALSNLAGRFETQLIETVDDGWLTYAADTDINPALKTHITPELAKTILSRNQSPDLLRLPWEVNPLFQQWLAAHFPERAERVMNRIRDMRGEGLWADMIRQRFAKGLKRYGLGKSGRFAQLERCWRSR